MNRGPVLFVLLLPLLAVGVLVKPSPISAAPATDGVHLLTSPLPIAISGKPGTTVTADLKVQNIATKAQTLKTVVYTFSALGEEGKPSLREPRPEDQFTSWMSFSEKTFTVEPQQWKTVRATITIPPYAAFGYYYAVAFIPTEVPDITGSPLTNTTLGGPATLILLDVEAPGANRQLQLLEFSTDKKVYEFLPTTFNVRLHNAGNVHVLPHGNIFIDQGEKHDLAALSLNEGQGYILPDSNRVYTVSWNDGFPLYKDKVENGATVLDDKGNRVKELSWDFSQVSKFRFGKYKASMVVVYDDGSKDVTLEGTAEFWVLPWRIMIGAGIVVLLMAYALYRIIRRFIRFIRRISHRGKTEGPIPGDKV